MIKRLAKQMQVINKEAFSDSANNEADTDSQKNLLLLHFKDVLAFDNITWCGYVSC